jgi:hypothetical protein
MADLSLLKEYKDHYDHELKVRDSLGGSLTMPVALLTVLGSVLFYIISNLSVPLTMLGTAQMFFVALSGISMVITIYF